MALADFSPHLSQPLGVPASAAGPSFHGLRQQSACPLPSSFPDGAIASRSLVEQPNVRPLSFRRIFTVSSSVVTLCTLRRACPGDFARYLHSSLLSSSILAVVQVAVVPFSRWCKNQNSLLVSFITAALQQPSLGLRRRHTREKQEVEERRIQSTRLGNPRWALAFKRNHEEVNRRQAIRTRYLDPIDQRTQRPCQDKRPQRTVIHGRKTLHSNLHRHFDRSFVNIPLGSEKSGSFLLHAPSFAYYAYCWYTEYSNQEVLG